MTITPIPATTPGRVPEPPFTGWPAPVARWLSTRYPNGVPRVETVVYSGPVRLRPAGPIWLRAHARMGLQVGRDRVVDFRVGLGPLTVLRVLDASSDGTGLSRIGRKDLRGPGIDQATFIAMLGESLPYPWAWQHIPGLHWEPIDADRAAIIATFAGAEERATVTFDRETTDPVAFEASRCRDAAGPRLPWRAESLDWGVTDGVCAPGRFVVTWGDQSGPWFRMRIDRVEVNADLAADLARARQAIAGAGHR